MAILTEGDPAGLQTNGPHPAPTTTPGRAIALAIGVVGSLWLTVFPYSAALNNPNERTRVLQARAIVDSGTLAVGTAEPGGGGLVYRDIYGRTGPGPFVNDISVRCQDPAAPIPCAGLLYPAKAPGTALLGVPALALARWVGYVDDGPDGEARATWILRLAVMAFTLAGLVALGMLLWRADVRPPIIAGTIVAAGLGSSVFPYGVSFVGHAAAGAALLLGVLALVLAGDGPASRSRTAFAILGGLLTGSAVLFEYHALPAAFAVGVWTLVSPARRRLLPGFIVGGLIAGMAFGWLHNAMFGSPWATGHTTLVSAHNRASQELGFLGIDGLHAGALLALLFDPYLGLGPDMPWLLVAGLGGLPLLARSRLGRLPPGASRTVCAAAVLYVLFVSSLGKFRMMNGWSFGPRYFVPAMLPMALAAGVFWDRVSLRRPWLGAVIGALVVHSVVVMVALSIAYPSPPADILNPFGELAVPLLLEGYGVRTIGLGLGSGWWLPTGLLGLGALAIVAWAAASGTRKPAKAALALVLGITLAAGYASWRPSPRPDTANELEFMRSTVEGAGPTGNGSFFGPNPQEVPLK